MKWTNRGHQLDELGERYLKVKNLYIWGIDESAKKAVDFLKWLGVAGEFNICFVSESDSFVRKTLRLGKNVALMRKDRVKAILEENKSEFEELPVISKREFHARLSANGTHDEDVVALTAASQIEETDALKNLDVSNLFYLIHSHNRRDNFIQNFVCVWMMYKHNKLISHWTNFLTTLRCNLNCECCLNFYSYISNPKDATFDEFKNHMDILFSKFDYMYSLHFSGGESMLVKELPRFIQYLNNNYKDRIFEFFIVTNSTIIPSTDVIAAIKQMGGRIIVNDYSENVPTSKVNQIPKIVSEHGVHCDIGKPSYWIDLDIDYTDNSNMSDDELEEYKNNCNSFLHEFGNGKISACCFQKYAERAGLTEDSPNDYIKITDSSKMEILEFRQGYTDKGYLDFCKRCKGFGENTKKIRPAVQMPKTNTVR